MIRPVMVATMVLGTLAVIIVANQVVNLNAEIVSGAQISGALERVFDLPTHFLLLLGVLPASLAIIGIWRSFR